MALPVRADVDLLARFAGEVAAFSQTLELRSVRAWIDSLPLSLREEPSFRELLADLDRLQHARANLEELVRRLQRQLHHLREYLAGMEYRYQYANKSGGVNCYPRIDYGFFSPQRYTLPASDYAVPDAYASKSRVHTAPGPGALEGILSAWFYDERPSTQTRSIDDRLTQQEEAPSDRGTSYLPRGDDMSGYSG